MLDYICMYIMEAIKSLCAYIKAAILNLLDKHAHTTTTHTTFSFHPDEVLQGLHAVRCENWEKNVAGQIKCAYMYELDDDIA